MSTITQIDWQSWRPDHEDTLLFVRNRNQVLLIRKKRGLGAGNINGPGGKIDPGETPLECAIRETREELLIEPTGVEFRGMLRFESDDFGKILGYVFVASGFEGTPTETAEAIPLWFDIDKIPFDQMWDDDIYWLPHALHGKFVDACFIFSGERMIDYQITVAELPAPGYVDLANKRHSD